MPRRALYRSSRGGISCLARWYFGDVVRVSASLGTFVHRMGVDGEPMETANDSAFVLLDFANGAHAVVHVGTPNIVGPGLQHTGQTVILSGADGTLETPGDPWTHPLPPVSEIVGFRRGADTAERLVVAEADSDGADPGALAVFPGDAFAVFWTQSIGPRLFIDAILDDRPACCSGPTRSWGTGSRRSAAGSRC